MLTCIFDPYEGMTVPDGAAQAYAALQYTRYIAEGYTQSDELSFVVGTQLMVDAFRLESTKHPEIQAWVRYTRLDYGDKNRPDAVYSTEIDTASSIPVNSRPMGWRTPAEIIFDERQAAYEKAASNR